MCNFYLQLPDGNSANKNYTLLLYFMVTPLNMSISYQMEVSDMDREILYHCVLKNVCDNSFTSKVGNLNYSVLKQKLN